MPRRSTKTENVDESVQTPAEKKPTRSRARKPVAAVETPVTNEVVVDAEIVEDADQKIVAPAVNMRRLTRRYAAISAFLSGLKNEQERLKKQILDEHRRSGAKKFETDLGDVNVVEPKPKFSIVDRDAYVAFMIERGLGDHVEDLVEIDTTDVDAIIDVLNEHAPHLLRTTKVLPEWVENIFTNGLEHRIVTTDEPVIGPDGTQVINSDINPLTGEVTDIPKTEKVVKSFAIFSHKEDVAQEDGSTSNEKVTYEVPFVQVTPGTPTVSYPSSNKQKVAKAKADAFFDQGNLEITKEIVRPKEIES